MRGTVVCIVGPTATGKTAVSIELAKALCGEIISADSMAIYKYMDIGTAKPTLAEQKQAVFHLIDIICPDEEFSAAEFRRLAWQAIDDIQGRNKLPLLVGGTGLYVKAVTGRINIPIAGPDWELREQLKSEAEKLGNEYLLDKLKEVDPVTANRLHANDLNRIIRALEVYTLTGHPISYYHQTSGSMETPYDFKFFGLRMEREILYRRIEDRIDQQIRDGFIDEVKSLLDKGYSPELTSMKGLGYKQITGYLMGQYDLQTAIDLLKRDTRRFAKRQFTWFRADPGIDWIDVDCLNPEDTADIIQKLLSSDETAS
ncbi:MAG: tRNA (adenosine(37)-N6)-dimethylallyltransferase MiaA [Armatimonadota bacterium]